MNNADDLSHLLGSCYKPAKVKGKLFLEVKSDDFEGFEFDFILVNGVRYEKPQNQPDE